ncbi:uncharacterized protein AMSG_05711 [Thecamonas trahens ATCC 50062]|uniref:RNase III domain-containing protein n=1 Tax=Thecamonas trahens ATCC 50062 TaxID=461836 RepID=A0A0L0DEB1_THETB|nr:hypothetical protein AMSG_05711 [Thecamonas trahens ATCC 50062]KNC49658.1 hypothetical protein AMSG_05711 [Thecamonas trahens ATCC 50062]|eukprot:XP_013757757.1 hypothetical protein AMSG_05711 [Thecamonas trahens ATCC 50062]
MGDVGHDETALAEMSARHASQTEAMRSVLFDDGLPLRHMRSVDETRHVSVPATDDLALLNALIESSASGRDALDVWVDSNMGAAGVLDTVGTADLEASTFRVAMPGGSTLLRARVRSACATPSTAIASNKSDTPFKRLAFIGDTVLTLMGRMQLFSLEDSAMDVGPMASAMQDMESREACQQYLKATGMDEVVLSDSYDIQAEAILCAIYLLYGLDDTERIWRMFVSAVASVDDAAPSGSSTSAPRCGKQERQQTVSTRAMESVAAWQGAELGVPDSDTRTRAGASAAGAADEVVAGDVAADDDFGE